MNEKERLAEQERIDGVKKEADELRKDIADREAKATPQEKQSDEFQKKLQDDKQRLAALDEDVNVTSPKLVVPDNAETVAHVSGDKSPELEPDPDHEGGFRVKENKASAAPAETTAPKEKAPEPLFK